MNLSVSKFLRNEPKVIEIANWRTFDLTALFSIERGTRLTRENRITGDIPLATAGEINEGVSSYISNDDMQRYSIVLTIDMFCNCFFRNYEFTCDDNIIVLFPKFEYNRYILLFMATVIDADKYRYAYGRQYRQKNFREHKIKLPVDKAGVPDWQFMESFAKKIYDTISPKITTNIKRKTFSFGTIEKWGKFKMDDIFIFYKGKRLIKEDMTQGSTNFIASINDNNGTRERIDEIPAHQGNCITVNYNGSVGEAFYQSEPFCASDDVNVLYPKDWELNKYIGLFLVTIIRFNKYRFGYGRKWTLEKMKETYIALPIIKDNTPDWQFMEDYIKSLPYSDKI
jgi:hypothetical protein